MAIKIGWQNRNERRLYPLADDATGRDDAGNLLPNDIINDLKLTWPDSLGYAAYITAIAVTDRLVSVVFSVANEAGSNPPLGYVTLPKPVIPGRLYPIEPFATGVAGFAAFGDTQELYAGTFTQWQQTKLCPKAAANTATAGVSSLAGGVGGTPLQGVVELRAGNGISLAVEATDDPDTKAIVISLSEAFDDVDVAAFASPCTQRVEGGCSEGFGGEPILTINGIEPNAEGEFFIVSDESDIAAMLVAKAQGLLPVGHAIYLSDPTTLPDVCAALKADRFAITTTPDPTDDPVLVCPAYPTVACDGLPIIVDFSVPFYDLDWLLTFNETVRLIQPDAVYSTLIGQNAGEAGEPFPPTPGLLNYLPDYGTRASLPMRATYAGCGYDNVYAKIVSGVFAVNMNPDGWEDSTAKLAAGYALLRDYSEANPDVVLEDALATPLSLKRWTSYCGVGFNTATPRDYSVTASICSQLDFYVVLTDTDTLDFYVEAELFFRPGLDGALQYRSLGKSSPTHDGGTPLTFNLAAAIVPPGYNINMLAIAWPAFTAVAAANSGQAVSATTRLAVTMSGDFAVDQLTAMPSPLSDPNNTDPLSPRWVAEAGPCFEVDRITGVVSWRFDDA